MPGPRPTGRWTRARSTAARRSCWTSSFGPWGRAAAWPGLRSTTLELFLAIAGFEAARLSIRPFNEYLFAHLGSYFRSSEKERVTGTGFYVLGIGLSLALFRTDIASAAVCFLAVGDVAATTIVATSTGASRGEATARAGEPIPAGVRTTPFPVRS